MSATMKPGYKRTEAGVIPEDWEVKPIGDLIVYTKGYAFRSSDYKRDGVRIIRVSDTTFDSIKNDNQIFISEHQSEKYSQWKLNEFDIIISTVGSKPPMYDSMVGKAVIVNKSTAGSLLNQNAVLIRNKEKLQSKQVLILSNLRTKRYFSFIEGIFRGNANQASITLKDLFEFSTPLPKSTEEQNAIADAISDIESLASNLDQLIAKKHNIQQAAMQQLLTGQRRLPGFNAGWEVARLGEISFISKGEQLSQKRDATGLIPHFNGGVSASSYTDTANTPQDTIAISEGGNSCGYVQFITTPFWCGGHCYVVRPRGVENLFLYFALKVKQDSIMGLRVGSGLPNIQKSALNSFQIALPSSRDEQTAIATILSDMDAELATLETRRDKVRQLKQGMMQELLTGRIRVTNGVL